MDGLRPLRSSRALLALLVVALSGGELLEVHSEPLRAGAERAHTHAVETAATHAGAATHFDAAGAREILHCPLCTLRSHGARLLAPVPSALGPAAVVALAAVAAGRLPGGRDARGASRGRAPPVA
jgi:hypothetical protein